MTSNTPRVVRRSVGMTVSAMNESVMKGSTPRETPLIEVNEALENAKEQAFALGVSRGVDPFMTLSFMALTVIPTLRLTTRGVFDVIHQRYV